MKSKVPGIFFYILLIIIFAWGVAMRAPEVLSGNYLFGFDHGRDYLAAYNIAVNHKLTLIGAEVGAGSAGISHLFHGPGYFYLVALMYLLFKGDPYGGLLLMFLFGIGTLILTYCTTRKMFGKWGGILALLMVGISPLIAPQSRFLWNHHPSSFFIVMVLYLVYKIPAHPRKYLPAALFVSGFIYHFELAIAVPLVISVIVAGIVIYRIDDLKAWFYSVIALVIAFLPMIAFEARHGFMAVQGMCKYVFSGGSGSGIDMLRISDHFRSYLANIRDSFALERGFFPVSYLNVFFVFMAVLLGIFIFKNKDKTVNKFMLFLIITVVVSWGFFLLLNNTVWDYYLIHLHFAYIYTLVALTVWFFSRVRKTPVMIIPLLIAGLFIISNFTASVYRMRLNYVMDFPDYGGVEKIKGKRAVIDEVYRDAAGKPFSAFFFMAPVYTYPYEYLFKTYGKNTYGYAPGNEKKGLVYLIIEPDSKNWYKGWLETVIAGGEILEIKNFHTGHIIEKRMFPL